MLTEDDLNHIKRIVRDEIEAEGEEIKNVVRWVKLHVEGNLTLKQRTIKLPEYMNR